jgi:lipopolysaccharide exporter
VTGAVEEEPQSGDVRSNADLTEAVGSGLRWITYARIAIEITLLAGMVVLARLIPPAAFGMFALVLIVQELALALPMEGIGSALVQRRTVGRRHLEAGMALSLAVGVVLAGVTFLAASVLVAPLFGHETASLVKLATPWFLIGAIFSVPTAVLRRRLDFGRLSIVELTMTSTRAAASIALALAGLDAMALVIGNLIGMACSLALAMAYAPTPFPRWHTREVRELLPYGGPASLACVAWTGFRNGDYAIIGARLGASQAGFYYRAYQLAVEYQKKISSVMAQMAFPVLARSEGPEAMLALRHRMVRLLSVVLFPLLALLVVLAPLAVPWLFGSQWEPAVVPTQILAAGGAATLTIDAIGSALQAAGRAGTMLGFGVAHFVIYVVAVIAVSSHGIAAVSAAASIVHTLFLFVAYQLLMRGYGRSALRALWDDLSPALVSCAALVALAWPIQWALRDVGAGALVTMSLATAGGAIGYLAMLRITFGGAWHDLLAALRRIVPARLLSLPRWLPAAQRRLRRARTAATTER